MDEIIEDGRLFNATTLRACTIEYTQYSPSADIYITIKISFDFKDAGPVQPTRISAIPVLPNTLETTKEYEKLVTYVVRCITCTWTCFVLYLKWKGQLILGNKFASNVRDILQLAFSIIPVCYAVFTDKPDPVEYVQKAIDDPTQYTDFYTIGK